MQWLRLDLWKYNRNLQQRVFYFLLHISFNPHSNNLHLCLSETLYIIEFEYTTYETRQHDNT